ncbi:cytochrome c oxidase assembly protein COX19 [Salpingoeca rosetta]|uniref:Cytochrome c oxidase assembly protein COX19 n=1 Tax=Salpingoeca rosetta (strain ATCC 50818 / BSB-021) TaxID=946362 RepID=F2U1G0_SALR5|nr:cytochrome c oxidase assembly protein COX19 [Salpingoeca rosetta]EGD81462.1 cytochrome c oxidase assembly protein COX19 [Salpingoeca rosetta]|eukprot:XP_004996666.1 cytochrome c oxidase assembly protein COX19 [Salpingoeca rosetta]
MGMPNAGSKTFQATPPDKGSFPLDHDGECKQSMKVFLECLRKNNNNGRKCRVESKAYLQCRMEKQLMAKEDWAKLGYAQTPDTAPTAASAPQQQQQPSRTASSQ